VSFLFYVLFYFLVGDLLGLITILCCMDYIYLLQEREFVTRAENVYKIGRTTQVNFTRFNQYPKSSKLYFQSYCGDCHICEREIIALFTERYIRRLDIGGEYFEGDVGGMISDMCAIVQNYFKLGEDERMANENAAHQEKERRRQLEKKRQMQKIARMQMVEIHQGNKQKRRFFCRNLKV
jgi:T5orf172 domain